MSKQYGSLREKIAAEKLERETRYAGYEALFARANAEGFRAGETMTPRAMVVCRADGTPIERVSDGMCGFAWVRVKSANKGFGHWLLKTGRARKGYYGGAEIWISAHNQSYERKLAHAQRMAQIFNENAIEAYGTGRLD